MMKLKKKKIHFHKNKVEDTKLNQPKLTQITCHPWYEIEKKKLDF